MPSLSSAFLFVVFALYSVYGWVPGSPEQESILMDVKQILDPSGEVLFTWNNSTDCEGWMGVTCNNIDYFVTNITVPFAGLQGSLPAELGNITSLFVLNLTGNWLQGSIPESIGSLRNLEVLDLSQNSLSGEIPPSIGNLSYLSTLNLHANNLEGPIPLSLGNLQLLRALNLAFNFLKGEIPIAVWSLVQLQKIDLSFNGLSGTVSSAQAGAEELLLAGNSLSGNISGLFSGSPSLRKLDLSFNAFTGSFRGPFPANMTSLSLRGNGLHGSLDDIFSEGLEKLQLLDVSSNHFSGTVPSNLSLMGRLRFLDLSSNALSGPLPAGILRLKNLEEINLASNQLSGPISALNFSSLEACTLLSLGNNSLSGGLPLALPRNITALDMSRNQLRGEVGEKVLEGLQRLALLFMEQNRFSGEVPPQLWTNQKPAALALVDLSSNRFTQVPRGSLNLDLSNGSSLLRIGGNPLCLNLTSNVLPPLCNGSRESQFLEQIMGDLVPCGSCKPLVTVTVLAPNFPDSLSPSATLLLSLRIASALSAAVPHFMPQQVVLENVTAWRSATVLTLLILEKGNTSDRSNRQLASSLVSFFISNRSALGPEFGSMAFLGRVFQQEAPQSSSDSVNSSKFRWWMVGAICSVLFVLVACVCLYLLRKRSTPDASSPYEPQERASLHQNLTQGFPDAMAALRLSSTEVKRMAGGYLPENILWQSDRKTYYRAALPSAQPALVVCFRSRSSEAYSFLKLEVLFSQLNLQRVAPVAGFSFSSDSWTVVYRGCSRGPLSRYLGSRGSEGLGMKQRLEIAVEIADALRELHFSAEPRVVHGRLCLDNVLLDEKWNVKLCGFDRAQQFPAGQPMGKQEIREEVRNFGEVLLRMFCRETERENFVEWALESIDGRQYASIADPQLEGRDHLTCLEMIVDIAKECLKYSTTANCDSRSFYQRIKLERDTFLRLNSENRLS